MKQGVRWKRWADGPGYDVVGTALDAQVCPLSIEGGWGPLGPYGFGPRMRRRVDAKRWVECELARAECHQRNAAREEALKQWARSFGEALRAELSRPSRTVELARKMGWLGTWRGEEVGGR